MNNAAVQFIIDTRKFEIELYWKRAAYFWAFIAAAFGVYIALLSRGEPAPPLSYSWVTCLGYLFSLAWYCANRGSKYWQSNWEAHLDCIEAGGIGRIYKTILEPAQFRLWRIASPYAFSVSRINQILSFSLTALWLGLFILHGVQDWPCDRNSQISIALVYLVGFGGSVGLLTAGKTGRKDPTLRFKQRAPQYLEPDTRFQAKA
jgi:hypothetical protein